MKSDNSTQKELRNIFFNLLRPRVESRECEYGDFDKTILAKVAFLRGKNKLTWGEVRDWVEGVIEHKDDKRKEVNNFLDAVWLNSKSSNGIQ